MPTPFSELIQSNKPVLVDFFATWCGPCRTIAPILKEVKSNLGDKVSIIKINVDQNPRGAAAYDVQGVPTLILFRNGSVVWRHSGVVSANQLEQVIAQHTGQ